MNRLRPAFLSNERRTVPSVAMRIVLPPNTSGERSRKFENRGCCRAGDQSQSDRTTESYDVCSGREFMRAAGLAGTRVFLVQTWSRR